MCSSTQIQWNKKCFEDNWIKHSLSYIYIYTDSFLILLSTNFIMLKKYV